MPGVRRGRRVEAVAGRHAWRWRASDSEVQPVAGGAAVDEEAERGSMTNAGHMNQYDIMFSFGNAMSVAPIMSGIRKLPKAPVSNGMITKKIITEACMLKSML